MRYSGKRSPSTTNTPSARSPSSTSLPFYPVAASEPPASVVTYHPTISRRHCLRVSATTIVPSLSTNHVG